MDIIGVITVFRTIHAPNILPSYGNRVEIQYVSIHYLSIAALELSQKEFQLEAMVFPHKNEGFDGSNVCCCNKKCNSLFESTAGFKNQCLCRALTSAIL